MDNIGTTSGMKRKQSTAQGHQTEHTNAENSRILNMRKTTNDTHHRIFTWETTGPHRQKHYQAFGNKGRNNIKRHKQGMIHMLHK